MKTKLMMLIGITLLGVTTAKANDQEVGNKKDVNGYVTEVNKKPVSDVNVTAYLLLKKEKTVTTNEGGNYFFDDLKPGTYKFVFEKEGYKKVVKEKIIIKTDDAFQMNIEMIRDIELDLGPTPFHFSD